MEITLTITGDAISPEVIQMLQALGIALQGGKVEEPEQEPKPLSRKTRKKKEEPAEATEPEAETEDTTKVSTKVVNAVMGISLESLREKALVLFKSGKTDAFKAVLDEFGYASLSKAKKEDYAALDAKLSAI